MAGRVEGRVGRVRKSKGSRRGTRREGKGRVFKYKRNQQYGPIWDCVRVELAHRRKMKVSMSDHDDEQTTALAT